MSVILLAACTKQAQVAATDAVSGAGPNCSGPEIPVSTVCGIPLQSPTLSCSLPADVQGGLLQRQFYIVQRATDLFSWQEFIALNWPAAAQPGIPDPNRKPGSSGPSVWETWSESGDVFRHDSAGQPLPPLKFGQAMPLPAKCNGADRVLFRLSKVDDLLDDVAQPTGSDNTLPLTLTDQQRELTRYEIRLNSIAYQSIVSNTWWDASRQTGAVALPVGAVLVKAAWIPIATEDAARFRAIDACVCDADPRVDPGQCTVRKMGLAGFHIMSKTQSAKQWIWSTFEQISNVDALHGFPATFNRPDCRGCEVNRQTPLFVPNQIIRRIPIPASDPACTDNASAVDNVAALNRSLQAALPGAFANYQLIGTQWPVPGSQPAGQPTTVFSVLPALLGNTTLESFIQNSSSCMGCHAMARSKRRDSFVSADFTFVLGLAHPKRIPGAPILPPPPCPTTDPALRAICAGEQIAARTYELLAPRYVGAKLHCGSCHLDKGRNANASWWVDMQAKWSQRPGGLYGRINQCFENSLNGRALCDEQQPGSCERSASMQDLVAYMNWITATWTPAIPKPLSPFPSVGDGKGLGTHGKIIFLQKCAFCHGVNGNGRYAHDSYFRPALWGDRSFNVGAGMDNAGDLAPFLHGNMPFHSGGELTDQESRDLACYVDGRPRPVTVNASKTVKPIDRVTCTAQESAEVDNEDN